VPDPTWGGWSEASGEYQQLSHKVAAHVREGIMIGQIPAHEFLRTERLAAELKVSATPVREALMVLQGEGAVRWEPRRGYRVTSVSDHDVRDLFLVQAYVAGELAARAVAALEPGEVARLVDIQKRLEEAAQAGLVADVDALNHEIHRRINVASGSFRLAALLKQTVQYVPLRFFGTVDGWSEASAHDHGAVFAALEAGDVDATREAMSAHIRHIGELLIDHLQTRRQLVIEIETV
jgi:DNA-binding GntR family transcriptional regulator